MTLAPIDWIIILLYLILSVSIAFVYRKSAGRSLADFFVGGRNLPWYIAGISMVATTFAADTPLAVTELVGNRGISGNWLWWNMLIGGMLTTFFFAGLWRKSEVITEPELIELRYGGKPAAILRGFKAIYLGIVMNVIVIGWVNVALMSLLQVFFNIPPDESLWYAAAAMLIVAIYSSVGGLLGVAITDMVQFFIAMTGCIILAIIVVNSEKVGGVSGLQEKLPEWTLNFFPTLSNADTGTGSALTITLGAFLAYVGMQWWASWYPGAEPGGGGYIAQRMMSTKNEKHSVFATLFFQVAHYALRPWPWIMVGLAAIVLYPDLSEADKKLGYVMAMKEFLPAGLKGLLLVAFLAAYMSTISTQLNWGASFITNDIYKRFIIKKDETDHPEIRKKYVNAGRIATLIIMALAVFSTSLMGSISAVWEFVIECGAGLGLVLILRWYWWRINAWSEISATIAPFIFYAISRFIIGYKFPDSFFFTVSCSTITWIIVTYATRPEPDETLRKFYNKVKPEGSWPARIKSPNPVSQRIKLLWRLAGWLSAVVFTYSLLFLMGKLIFTDLHGILMWTASAAVSFCVLWVSLRRITDD
ncbi:MAG: Na+:solute symporter [Bacteroidetes bacterium]|nr:Na+:solute symporter [Bacteroidota bacterium]MBU1720275.1 Na+:solute symporter [Bacteroidota bacterium]